MWIRAISSVCAAVAAISLYSPPAKAEHHTFAIGLALGTPTAIDFKWRPTHVFGFNAGIGVHHFAENLAVYGDFEFALVEFAIRKGPTGAFYIGPGVQLGVARGKHVRGFHDEDREATYLGLMCPIGVEFSFPFPLEIFIELRPGLILLDDPLFFDLGAQVGFRAGW